MSLCQKKPFLVIIAVIMTVILVSTVGCGKRNGGRVDTPPPLSGTPKDQTPLNTAPLYGHSNGAVLYAPNASMTAFVDADRGSDFVVHGVLHLPGTGPSGQDVFVDKFVLAVGATSAANDALRGSVGKAVELYGRYDGTGSGRGVFTVTGTGDPTGTVSPSREFVGWGKVLGPEKWRGTSLNDIDALTIWVRYLDQLRKEAGIPAGGAVDANSFLSSLETSGQLPQVKAKLAKSAPEETMLYGNSEALDDLRTGRDKFCFITKASATPGGDVLVYRADVTEDDVARFMEAAKGASGGEGLHKEDEVTIYGHLVKAKNKWYLSGVEGNSFSEWMDNFRNGGSGVTWELYSISFGPKRDDGPETFEGEYGWFVCKKICDPITKKWYVVLGENTVVLYDSQYKTLMSVLKQLI